MAEILDTKSPIIFDDSISSYEYHVHQPYAASNFNNNDKIRIIIQNQEHYLLPCRSLIHVQGKLVKPNGAQVTKTKLVNNAICHLFSEIRYIFSTEVIDDCKNPGITSLMKGYPSVTPNNVVSLEKGGWLHDEANQSIEDANGNFDIIMPLKLLFGFSEDYERIVVYMKHELILVRSNNDTNAIIQTEEENFKIHLSKIEWLMPYVLLPDKNKINMLRYIEKNPEITIGFRSWDLYEYPILPETTKHLWTVKTSSQLEKPRFVIVGFQTGRNRVTTANASHFDHCKLSNIKLYLNSQSYPYNNLNIDMKNNAFSIIYEMFKNFQVSYYNKDLSETIIGKTGFKENVPLFIIDCSKQNETLKYSPVDIRLEFEALSNFPKNTTAFCLILHDRIFSYKPISGEIKKIS